MTKMSQRKKQVCQMKIGKQDEEIRNVLRTRDAHWSLWKFAKNATKLRCTTDGAMRSFAEKAYLRDTIVGGSWRWSPARTHLGARINGIQHEASRAWPHSSMMTTSKWSPFKCWSGPFECAPTWKDQHCENNRRTHASSQQTSTRSKRSKISALIVTIKFP